MAAIRKTEGIKIRAEDLTEQSVPLKPASHRHWHLSFSLPCAQASPVQLQLHEGATKLLLPRQNDASRMQFAQLLPPQPLTQLQPQLKSAIRVPPFSQLSAVVQSQLHVDGPVKFPLLRQCVSVKEQVSHRLPVQGNTQLQPHVLVALAEC